MKYILIGILIIFLAITFGGVVGYTLRPKSVPLSIPPQTDFAKAINLCERCDIDPTVTKVVTAFPETGVYFFQVPGTSEGLISRFELIDTRENTAQVIFGPVIEENGKYIFPNKDGTELVYPSKSGKILPLPNSRLQNGETYVIRDTDRDIPELTYDFDQNTKTLHMSVFVKATSTQVFTKVREQTITYPDYFF